MKQEVTTINKTPTRAGLIFDPSAHRWVSASARKPGTFPVTARNLQKLSDTNFKAIQRSAQSKLQTEKDSKRLNDLYRVNGIIQKEAKRRTVSKTLGQAARMHKRISVQEVMEGTDILLKGMSIDAAIPIEQLKGDLARAGHPVKSLIALDPESHRLFFMDTRNNPLYAEFSDASGGFEVQRIGYQSEVSKEYDVVDLKPDDTEEDVVVTNEEEDYNDTPGMIPGPTPNVKPDRDKDYFEEFGQSGDGLGDTGFGDEQRPTSGRTTKSYLEELDNILR